LAIFAAIRRASALLIVDFEFGGIARKLLLLLGKSVVTVSPTQIRCRAGYPRQGAAFLSAVAKSFSSGNMIDSSARSLGLLHGSPHPQSQILVRVCVRAVTVRKIKGLDQGLRTSSGSLAVFTAEKRPLAWIREKSCQGPRRSVRVWVHRTPNFPTMH